MCQEALGAGSHACGLDDEASDDVVQGLGFSIDRKGQVPEENKDSVSLH